MSDTMTKPRDGKVDWELVQAASKAASKARKTSAATPQIDEESDEESGVEDVWLTARKTAERLGKSVRTLNRWLDDPDIGLPPPMIVKGWRYFSLAKLKKFERRRTIGKVG
jgi:hypothetical protein